MLVDDLYDILGQWRHDEIPVLLNGADIKRIRFDDKVQMLILDSDVTEVDLIGDNVIWEAD
jgi:hypothetical protein